jgi:cytochrome c oxidase subunit 3
LADAHAAEHPSALAHHFENLPQQREAAELGMWVFLVTEVMFFGGLFLAYLVYRWTYPAEFAAGSLTMDVALGTINTGLLLTSSLTMALAVHAAETMQRRTLLIMLAATIVLGSGFLGIKVVEYYHKYEHGLIPFARLEFEYHGPEARGMATFFNLYFLMTGLHALHMVIGIGVLVTLGVLAWRGGLLGPRAIVVFNTGLYWHFVDLVWVYLFPFFYLIASRGGLSGPAGH